MASRSRALVEGVWECAGADGLAKWRVGVDGLFPPVRVEALTSAFSGRIRAVRAFGLQLTDIDTVPQRVIRRPSVVSGAGDAFYKVSLQISGAGTFVQNDRETLMSPGDIAIYDASRPYLLEFSQDYRFLVATFPREALNLPRGLMGDLGGRVLTPDEGVGTVLSTYVRGLFHDLSMMRGRAGIGMSRAFFDLLGAFVDEQARGGPSTVGGTTRTLVEVLQYIDAHLADPGMDPRSIADAHHISVRQLYKLFESSGESVAERIRRRRLEEARRELADRSGSATIAEIARRWGFADPAYFGRVFRQTYGVTPGAWRSGG